MDNRKIIENKILKFEKDGDFYFCQTILRKKENPETPKSERLINSYYIYSLLDLEKKWSNIVDDCETYDARAYLWVNRRNDEKIALQMLRVLAENIANKTYKTRRIYNSICGKYCSEPDKKWIIDIDNEVYGQCDKSAMIIIRAKIIGLVNMLPPHGDKIKAITKTPNGYHLITSPFDLKKFREDCSADVHKDNGTILYSKYKNNGNE